MENNKKKNKRKLLLYFSIVLIFFLGIWTERFGVDDKVSKKINNLIDGSSRFVYGLFPSEKLHVDIKPKNYNKLLNNRKNSLGKVRVTQEFQEWVPGIITHNNISSNAEVRLKGIHADHWSDPEKWSLKIKINNDSKSILGLRRFAIQPPETLSYLYEWLFMKALEKEKLINLKVNFLNGVINGNNLGSYILQEQISDELFINNNRKEGPVIGFSSDLWVKEANNHKILHANGMEDSFFRSKINATQFKKNKIGTKQEDYLREAIYLLESFRNKTLPLNQIFDTDQLAKVMSLRAAIGASEFDWMDTKFYYNPETKLLEPISREAHVSLGFEDRVNVWWLDSINIKPYFNSKTNYFLDILYSDIIFYEKYLVELDRISKNNYYETLIKENQKEFDNFNRNLKASYPTKKIFSFEHLGKNSKKIQNSLNPIQGLNVYFIDYKKNYLSLDLANLQRIPIVVTGIEFKDKSKIYFDNPTKIKGRKPHLPLDSKIIKLNCKFKKECQKKHINKQKLIFKILGQKKERKADISEFYFNSAVR
jgi:hypothetical protein